jgi:hypothetical protein
MSEVTGQAVEALIDLVGTTATSAVNVLKPTADLAESLATAPIDVAGKTVDAALEEFQGLITKAVAVGQSIAQAIKDSPLP